MQIRCEVCGQFVPSYDVINYGSMDQGYKELCGRCFNSEVAKLNGLRSFESPAFRPVKNNVTRELDQHIDPASVFRNIVRKYGLAISREANGLCVHSMRATAGTNALENDADLEQRSSMAGTRASGRIARHFGLITRHSPFEYR